MPVWYHVHVVTDFRTDGEWKEIIHLIRLTAFELGILLNEKLSDTTGIPDGEFDVDKGAREFLTSVLLTWPARPRDTGSVDDRTDACVHSSMETTGNFHGHLSRDAYLDSSTVSASLIDGFSSNASPSVCVLSPETPTTDVNRLTPRSRATADSALVDCRIPSDSDQNSEPLVTSHGKVCIWCEMEGVELQHGTPTEEPYVHVGEKSEPFNQWINELAVPAGPLDIQLPGPFDGNIEGLDDPRQPWELPGLCRVESLPPLLYRWSNINSQGVNSETVFIAGWFTDTYPDVGSPRQMSETDFLSVFAAHVTRVQVPTPFISAFSRPLAPIHRALRNRENARIAVIDPRRISMPVFHAQPLAEVTQTTVPRWKGFGEYAIWGYVPSKAIITTFEVTGLEEITSWDHGIQQFLQLDLIQEQETCHRGLRRELRANIRDCSYESCCSMLRRLAFYLGVPEEYQEHFSKGIYEAWSMDFGPAYQDQEGSDDPATSPALISSDEVHSPKEVPQRVLCCNSASTASYVPPQSDDGSCSESTSEEGDDLSQSPEAPCPRRDTPSPAFSVDHDTDDSVELNFPRPRAREVEMLEVAVPPTTPSTSRYFAHSGNINFNSAKPPLDLRGLALSNSLNDDSYLSEAAEWPSESETLAGNDTPTMSRFWPEWKRWIEWKGNSTSA